MMLFHSQELQEVVNIKMLDKYKPITPFGYVGYNLLFSIPVIGLIMLIIYSFDNANINRRNYARSFFVTTIIAIALTLIFTSIFGISMLNLK